MAFLRAKPIGVMQMIDQGEQDDKVISQHNFRGIFASMMAAVHADAGMTLTAM